MNFVCSVVVWKAEDSVNAKTLRRRPLNRPLTPFLRFINSSYDKDGREERDRTGNDSRTFIPLFVCARHFFTKSTQQEIDKNVSIVVNGPFPSSSARMTNEGHTPTHVFKSVLPHYSELDNALGKNDDVFHHSDAVIHHRQGEHACTIWRNHLIESNYSIEA